MSISLIEKAVSIVGTKAELARKLGVSPPYVIKMLKTGHVPAERCRQIEHITGGEVRAEELRPDVFAPYAS